MDGGDLDYAAERAAFTWDTARSGLDGLPAGGLNIAYEAVDRHVVHGRGGTVAFRFLTEDGPDRLITYAELADLTGRFATVLAGLGVAPGDLVFFLSGRHPDLYVAMLGALKARCGVSPLFSAFGPEPVRQRMRAGAGRVLVTTSAYYRQKVAPVRGDLPDLEHVLLLDHVPAGLSDPGLQELAPLMAAASPDFAIPATDPEDTAFVHFTSGTTTTTSSTRAGRRACPRARSTCTRPASPTMRPAGPCWTCARATSTGAPPIPAG